MNLIIIWKNHLEDEIINRIFGYKFVLRTV